MLQSMALPRVGHDNSNNMHSCLWQGKESDTFTSPLGKSPAAASCSSECQPARLVIISISQMRKLRHHHTIKFTHASRDSTTDFSGSKPCSLSLTPHCLPPAVVPKNILASHLGDDKFDSESCFQPSMTSAKVLKEGLRSHL